MHPMGTTALSHSVVLDPDNIEMMFSDTIFDDRTKKIVVNSFPREAVLSVADVNAG